MGEDCGAWRPQLHSNWRPPNSDSLGAPLNSGQHNFFSSYTNLGANKVSTSGILPVYASAEVPHLRAEPHGWFYCLPRCRQAMPTSNSSFLKEKLAASPNEGCEENLKPKVEPCCAQKRFLVVDQSGDQTTLIFGSGIANPVHCLASFAPNSHSAYNLNGEDGGTARDLKNLSEPILTDEFNDNNDIDVQSEMHEDTEELNALLYSDDESSEDDEVTSTGHSPSTMTDFDRRNWFDGSNEEVASSGGTTKKRKLFDGAWDDKPSMKDTATSVKPYESSQLEDDAESSCANNKSPELREFDSLSSSKRMKREKIRETIGILQNIIPGGEGKDAVVVLDEAIQYLNSLKVKAKAFGFDSL